MSAFGDERLGHAVEAVVEHLGDGLGLLGGHSLRLELPDLRRPQPPTPTPASPSEEEHFAEHLPSTRRTQDVEALPGRGCRRGMRGSCWS